MEKQVPYSKLSPRKKRALNARRRGGWGGINPITRKPENPKAYSRKKAPIPKDDRDGAFSCFLPPCVPRAKVVK